MTLTYRDPRGPVRMANGDYAVSIVGSGVKTKVYVGAPAYLEHAVDSPIAYDRAAHAAISFADEEEPGVGEHAAMTDTGWLISRTKEGRWGTRGRS